MRGSERAKDCRDKEDKMRFLNPTFKKKKERKNPENKSKPTPQFNESSHEALRRSRAATAGSLKLGISRLPEARPRPRPGLVFFLFCFVKFVPVPSSILNDVLRSDGRRTLSHNQKGALDSTHSSWMSPHDGDKLRVIDINSFPVNLPSG